MHKKVKAILITRSHWVKEGGDRRVRHRYVTSKMKKTKPLLGHRAVAKHIPATHWYTPARLINMLSLYPVLYIKPDRGSCGKGIIRVKKQSAKTSLISCNKTSIKVPSKDLVKEIEKRMRRGKNYVIQQGITLATYRNKPFDLRIVLQKPAQKWRLTWMSAKVASSSSSIVTNVAQGARDAKIVQVLRGSDQSLNTPRVLNDLKRISTEIAYTLGSRFPFRIIGLDMAVDKRGKVWFIEANSKPSFHGLRSFDPIQYKRYLRAKKQIEANP